MILLEQIKHATPCWEAKGNGDPLLTTWKFILPYYFKAAPLTLK